MFRFARPVFFALLSCAYAQEKQQGPLVHVNRARSEIGCETKGAFEEYHTSTYEKDGAEPRTKGCVRLAAGTELKRLGQKDVATIVFGDKVAIERYEASIKEGSDKGVKTVKVWLSPSSIEENVR
jgi:hypothetical protein